MAAQSPPERGPTPRPGEPGPGGEPLVGGESPGPAWPNGVPVRDEPQWPTGAAWPAGAGRGLSGGPPSYGPVHGPVRSGDVSLPGVVPQGTVHDGGPSAL